MPSSWSLLHRSLAQDKAVIRRDMPGHRAANDKIGPRPDEGADLQRAAADEDLGHVAGEKRARDGAGAPLPAGRKRGLQADGARAEGDCGAAVAATAPRIARAQHRAVGETRLHGAVARGAGNVRVDDVAHAEKTDDEAGARRGVNLGRRAVLLDAAPTRVVVPIRRAHILTPVTPIYRMPSSALIK